MGTAAKLGDVSGCGTGARVVACCLTKTFTKSEELYPAESSVLSSNGSVALSSNAGTIKLVNLSWDSNGSMGVDAFAAAKSISNYTSG